MTTPITFENPIAERIRLVEARMQAEADGNHPDLAAALLHLISAGGKRVRPTITLLMGDLLGADSARLITLAASIEMLHTATLVHDDLIDGALLRRGMVTLNAEWSPAATVLSGDFVFARAAKLAAETNSVPVMHLFAEALTIIVNGEINQLFSSRGLASRDDYYRRIHAKTASMFELATGAASLLSPVDERMRAAARRFGYEIGMAFQIVDDVLDYTGDQEQVGKPVASDLRQGLINLPALIYLEKIPDDPRMKNPLEGNPFPEDQLTSLIVSIRESGAIKQSMEEARQFVKRGLEALATLPKGPENDALMELANYIVGRNY